MPLPAIEGRARAPRLSPDGKRVALRLEAGRGGLWVGEPAQPAVKVLSDGGEAARLPLGWIDPEWILVGSCDAEGACRRVGALPAGGGPGFVEHAGSMAWPAGGGAALVAGTGELARWEPRRGRGARVAPVAPGRRVERACVAQGRFAFADDGEEGGALWLGAFGPAPGARKIFGPLPETWLAPALVEGGLLALAGGPAGAKLFFFDAAGRAERTLFHDRSALPSPGLAPLAASPDGKRALVLRAERSTPSRSPVVDAWLVDVATGELTRATSRGDLAGALAWPAAERAIVEGEARIEALSFAPDAPAPKKQPRPRPRPLAKH